MNNYKFIRSLVILFSSIFLISSCKEAPPSFNDIVDACIEDLKENAKNKELIRIDLSECVIGAEIPDFEAKTIEGQKINKQDLKGKVSIINFWFTTCPPCVAEVPGFNMLADKYGKDKVNFIAIGRDKKKDLEEFLDEHPWDFRHIYNAYDLSQDTFRVVGYPTTLVLNQDLEIAYYTKGGPVDSTAPQVIFDKLDPYIEKLLTAS